MRTFRRTSSCRALAWALIMTLITLYVPWGARPARAQATTNNVFVLDFNNRTNVGGALLGRVAAAQLSLQLSETDNWFVVPDAQVQRRIQEANLMPPFDRYARVQIANGVDATAVIYGNILDARVGTDARSGAPQAYVRVQVMVEDIATGVLINGAIVEGFSTPRQGFAGDADILLEEALGRAAFQAREIMDRFRLPEGTVLNTTVVGAGADVELDALINIGARQGVRRGMEMIVTRQRQLVGRVRVTSVDADLSTIRVLENSQGVRPEDRVRAIFNFSDFGAASRTLRRADANVKAPEAAARIAKVSRQDQFTEAQAPQDAAVQLAQGTVPTPPPVVVDEPSVERDRTADRPSRGISTNTARLLAGGALVLGILALGGSGGSNSTRADGVTAVAFQSPASTGAEIRVTWDRPKQVTSSQVVQYIVWRRSLADGHRIRAAFDGDSRHVFVDDEDLVSLSSVYDGAPNSDDAGERVAIADIPGLIPGERYSYAIATAFERGVDPDDDDDDDDDDDEDEVIVMMSPLSEESPNITAINRPVILTPPNGEPIAFDELVVTWQQAEGANEYVVVVTKSPNPPTKKGKGLEFGPFRTVPVGNGGEPSVTQALDISRRGFQNAQEVWVWVGARNSQDPRPQPRGAIFGAPVRVVNPENPPPVPSNASTKGRKAAKRSRK